MIFITIDLMYSVCDSLYRFLVIILVMIGFGVSSVGASGLYNTTMRFEIVNSYTGSLDLLSHGGTWLFDQSGDKWWTNQHQAHVRISSNKDSSYVFSGDFSGGLVSEGGSGLYYNDYIIDLTNSQSAHYLSVDFMSYGEPLSTPGLTIVVDDAAPSISELLVADGVTLSGDLHLSWSTAVDTGVGIMNYTVFMGLTPSLESMVAFVTSGTQLVIPSSMIPKGTIYWTVVATDYLGNQSEYVMGYIHYELPTIIQIGPSLSNQGGFGADNALPTIVPVFIFGPDGRVHASAPRCRGKRISHLKSCTEWDDFIIHSSVGSDRFISSSYISGAILSGKVMKNVITTDLDTNNSMSDLLNKMVISPLSYDNNQQSPISQLMYQRYVAHAPAGRRLPDTGADPSLWSDMPDYHDYESVLMNYGENFVPRTKEFSGYIMILLFMIGGGSVWFFWGGYHHRYVIKYLK